MESRQGKNVLNPRMGLPPRAKTYKRSTASFQFTPLKEIRSRLNNSFSRGGVLPKRSYFQNFKTIPKQKAMARVSNSKKNQVLPSISTDGAHTVLLSQKIPETPESKKAVKRLLMAQSNLRMKPKGTQSGFFIRRSHPLCENHIIEDDATKPTLRPWSP